MRETSRIDLTAAIRSLVAPAGSLRSLDVHLDMPEAIELDDSAQAHALLRAVQEILTNATRHASARNLWIRLERSDRGIALHARDDGAGTDRVTWGNGLTGMRERFEEYSGQFDVVSTAGKGFEIHGFMPGAEAAR